MSEEPKIVYPVASPDDQLKDLINQNPAEPVVVAEPVEKKDIVSIDNKDYILDESGNALDEAGKVFKTKVELEDLKKSPTPKPEPVEQVEINGVLHEVDSNGNAVLNGEIKFTKEQIDKMSVPTDHIVNNLKGELNIIPVDDGGKEIEYTDDKVGLSKYVSDVLEIGRGEGATEAIDALFSDYPSLREAYLYAQAHNGILDGFSPSVDYSKFEITAETTELNTNLVVEAEMARGKSREEALRIAKYYSTDGILFDEAKKSKDYLDSLNKARVKEYETAVEEQRRENVIKGQEFWGVGIDDKGQMVVLNNEDGVYNKVKKGTLRIGENEVTIPDRIRILENGTYKNYTKEDFFNYMFIPQEYIFDNGSKAFITGYQYDQYVENNRKTKDDFIFEAFKTFVKNDQSQILQSLINAHEVKKLKEIRKLTFKSDTTISSKDKTTGSIVYPVK